MNRQLVSPCGLYCGACGIYLAHAAADESLKKKLAAAYGVTPEQVACRGCLSDEVFVYCRTCPIKQCTSQRNIEGCSRCDDFPCEHIESFPVEEGKKVILREVPRWNRMETGEWVADQEAHYACSSCGGRLFRGARRCRSCGGTVSV